MLNPYAPHLGDRDPLEVIARTPAELERLLRSIGPERAEASPAPGKWCVREILCHLADCELAFGFRLRQALAEPHHVIQPFDQEKWAATYAGYQCDSALAAFSAVRHWNLALIKSVEPAAFSRVLTHPERGEMTFRTLVETMGGHDLNHIQQVEAIGAKGATA